MQNPFETGHIKNYILLYVSVVVIMVLFFIAATLFRDTKIIEEKVFNTKVVESKINKEKVLKEDNPKVTKFKLLEENLNSYSEHTK